MLPSRPQFDDSGWLQEVRRRLITWGAWAAGPHLYSHRMSPIAAMIKRAAGELPGDDLSVPRELTFELHVTERALGLMKLSEFARDRQARRLLVRVYLQSIDNVELERQYNWSPDMRKIQVWRAESIAGRYMIEMERNQDLRELYKLA